MIVDVGVVVVVVVVIRMKKMGVEVDRSCVRKKKLGSSLKWTARDVCQGTCRVGWRSGLSHRSDGRSGDLGS